MTQRIAARVAETTQRIHEAQRAEIHTCMPARVISYDRDTQTIDAEILVREIVQGLDEEDLDTARDYPTLRSVPVAGMRMGSLVIHSDLQAGEEVWIVFTESDLSRWRETGEISDPGIGSRHALSGAWAMPGAFSRPRALSGLSDKPQIKAGNIAIEWSGSNLDLGGNSALAEASPLSVHLGLIRADLSTVFGLLGAGVPAYAAPGVDSANPIATTITRGT